MSNAATSPARTTISAVDSFAASIRARAIESLRKIEAQRDLTPSERQNLDRLLWEELEESRQRKTLPADLTHPGSLGRVGNYRQLAAAIGMNRSHVSRVMRGKTGVNTDVARRLAGELGITVDALIAHRDAMARVPAEEICRCGHHVSAHWVTRTPATVGGEELVMVTRGVCEACPCTRFEVAKRRGRIEEPEPSPGKPNQ